jgi:hypothetical protein
LCLPVSLKQAFKSPLHLSTSPSLSHKLKSGIFDVIDKFLLHAKEGVPRIIDAIALDDWSADRLC